MTLLNFERAKNSSKYLISNIKYQLQKQLNSKTSNWVKSQFAARRLATFVLLTAMLPITISPVAAPSVAIDDSYKPHVVMNTNTAILLASDIKTVQIIPGESQVDKAAREKAEADAAAKAKADADAKAKLALSTRNTVTRERRVYNDPSNFDGIYAAAQAAYGVDARILKAIHMAETGGSGSTGLTNHSGSGATGPMQFMPSTWRAHGVDGNGDGVADINNVEDAIFTAAAYLKACGYPDVRKALWGYNPSTSYYNKVMRLAGM